MQSPSLLRTLFLLARISNLPTVWSNVAAGWFLSGGGWESELGWILLGMSLLYTSGMALNDAFDAGWDRIHARSRPIPSGRISAAAVWIWGGLQMAAGAAVLALSTTVHPLLLTGLVLAILAYNVLHKRWAGSVLLMGLCRALVYVGAGSAVVHHTTAIEVPASVYFAAAISLIYIAGLTLSARNEHINQRGPLARTHGFLLTSPVLLPLIGSSPLPHGVKKYLLVTVGIVVILIWITHLRREMQVLVPRGIAAAIAGIALYDAFLVVFADPRAFLFCLACFFLARLAQKKIPAT